MSEPHLVKIPLFPLETVLFPHATLQLHIYEDRYRQLVHDSGELSGIFGIVLLRTGDFATDLAEPYMVGTAVEITQLHSYPDGQIEIQVHGLHRFRIRKFDYDEPYLSGWIEGLDEIDLERDLDFERLIESAESGFQAIIQGLIGQPGREVQVIFPPTATALSFAIANLLQIENREKQRLLEMDSTEDRLRELIPAMKEQTLAIELDRDAFIAERTSIVYRVSSSDLADWTGAN
jgi:Lon protease-like protein